MDLDEHFVVGEALDGAVGEGELEIVGDGLGQGAVGVAGDQFHVAIPLTVICAGALLSRGSGQAQCDNWTEMRGRA